MVKRFWQVSSQIKTRLGEALWPQLLCVSCGDLSSKDGQALVCKMRHKWLSVSGIGVREEGHVTEGYFKLYLNSKTGFHSTP